MRLMMQNSVVVLLLSLTVIPLAHAELCDDPLRNQDICYKMKSLRSSMDILDAQRDLMQANFPLIKTVAEEVTTLTAEVTKKNPSTHLEALQGLAEQAKQLAVLAEQNKGLALTTANNLKNQCMSCHTEQNPVSGYKWSQISSNNWDQIVPHCNKEAANPYLCKSMYGMKTMYSYFFESNNSGVRTFKMTGEAARELKRIADDLAVKEIFHGSARMLSEVSKGAGDVVSLAAKQDPATYSKSIESIQSCLKCHGSIR